VQALLHELKQLTIGIAIGTDCVRARLTLFHQALREEALRFTMSEALRLARQSRCGNN
jgi:hypothetical protein